MRFEIFSGVKELETLFTNYENQTPEKTRRTYDTIWAIITRKQNELQDSRSVIDDSIQNLKDCEMLLIEINSNFEKIKKKLNRTKTGTLFGLAREKIRDNIGDYDVDNEQVDFVMNQPYQEILNGGKYEMTKRSRKKRTTRTRKRRR